MTRTGLLDRRAIRLTTGDVPVRSDIWIHNLDPFTLESLRRVIEHGLVPSGLKILDDDEPIVILRFSRPPVG